MQGRFEYFYTKQVNDELEIDDIGNCAICANNDLGACYFLVIKTELGYSTVFEYGPIVPGEDILPSSVTCSFKKLSFMENKIKKIIDGFLNNPYRDITQAQVVDEAYIYENCIDLIDYMKCGKDFI